ncbi:MAG: HAMP domain-containing sensor histidine kinase [Bryobacterales bacterium]|nr:HAMP domain-containing histidine kinase [Bryobacteraceae bacterium]MDW8129072.1 HAMP domain-containing sensor histidine kinase [Bryobacterales bacterium]
MRPRRDRSTTSFLVMGAAAGLLVVLAFLQYQWIGQLGEAERERLRIHLRAALFRFTQEFNAEVARIPAIFFAARPMPPEREFDEMIERWQAWKQSAPHPELLRAFYVTRGGEDGAEELYACRADGSGFERVEWPEKLRGLRARLEMRGGERSRGMFPGPRAWLDEESGVLVAPRWRAAFPDPRRGPGWRPGPREGPEGWLIAELDARALVEVLLPELVDRHFRRTEGFDFQLQVVRRSDRRVLYRSDPSLPEEPMSAPDAVGGLLEWRPAIPRWANEVPGPAAELPPGPGGPLRLEPEGRWQVLVKHRAGSLEAAVNRLRLRNLALSSAILALMAASLVTLIVYAQRSHRLARLQMEFVAGVSHELRTPLAVICSAGENLADGLVATGEQARRYGALIRNEGRRLAEMVEQVLAFAGMQAGRLKYNFQPLEVRDLIAQVTEACQGPAAQAGVEIETRIEEGCPKVLADPSALSQALRNLVQNALKYAGSGKWVGLRAAPSDGGRWLEIRVQDRGPGIAPSDMPHIFEPFYRGRNAGDAQARGAGLGLSLARSIVQAHRGAIAVESRQGEGATFIVRLPAAPAAEQHAGP